MCPSRRRHMTDTPGPKPSSFKTGDLIQKVAQRLFLPDDTVEMVLYGILEEIIAALLRKEKVFLRGLGSLVIKQHRLGYPMLKFKISSLMKETMREAGLVMEKYGVDLGNEAELVAKVTGECPSCKSALESTSPPKCPNCGTKPFERQTTMVQNFGTQYGKKEEE